MNLEPLYLAEWRAKHIFWCPQCGCDTMPNEHTGCCFWCETVIDPARVKAAPAPRKQPKGWRRCATCDGRFLVPPTVVNKRYCSEACRKQRRVVACVECGGPASLRSKAATPRCHPCAVNKKAAA